MVNVQYSEKLPHNLFSAVKMKGSTKFLIDDENLYLIDRESDEILKTAKCKGKFWKMDFVLLGVDLTTDERQEEIITVNSRKGGSPNQRFVRITIDEESGNSRLLYCGCKSTIIAENEFADRAERSGAREATFETIFVDLSMQYSTLFYCMVLQ